MTVRPARFEELDEGPEQWAPAPWVVPLVMLVGLLVMAGAVIGPPVRRALAPVRVSQAQLSDVFRPPLAVGAASWGWAYLDRPSTLGAGFCGGAMVKAFEPAGSVLVADGDRRAGRVFSARYADARVARQALEGLSRAYDGCDRPDFRVTAREPFAANDVVVRGFTIESVSRFRYGSLRREVRFVGYANTLAVFVVENAPDDEMLSGSWRAAVRRAAGRG